MCAHLYIVLNQEMLHDRCALDAMIRETWPSPVGQIDDSVPEGFHVDAAIAVSLLNRRASLLSEFSRTLVLNDLLSG
jgi:hypothetical protein